MEVLAGDGSQFGAFLRAETAGGDADLVNSGFQLDEAVSAFFVGGDGALEAGDRFGGDDGRPGNGEPGWVFNDSGNGYVVEVLGDPGDGQQTQYYRQRDGLRKARGEFQSRAPGVRFDVLQQ